MRRNKLTDDFLTKAIPALTTAVKDAVNGAMGPKAFDPRRELGSYPQRMSIRHLSTFWGCSFQHVCNLIDSGEIAAINIARRGSSQKCFRITRASVEAYEAKQIAKKAWVPRSEA